MPALWKLSLAAAAMLLLAGTTSAKLVNFTIVYGEEPNLDASFSKQAVAMLPKLFLHNPYARPGEKYTVAFWDNGCPMAPRLHYLQSGLTVDSSGQLSSKSKPEYAYYGAGVASETGDSREYVWALYSGFSSIKPNSLAARARTFDVETFEKAHKLHRVRTINMQVDLGGVVQCKKDQVLGGRRSTSTEVVTRTRTCGIPIPTGFIGSVQTAVVQVHSSYGTRRFSPYGNKTTNASSTIRTSPVGSAAGSGSATVSPTKINAAYRTSARGLRGLLLSLAVLLSVTRLL